MDAETDEQLMQAFREGDPRAFELLLARHERKVWLFLRRSVGDPVLAEDLLQEVQDVLRSHPGSCPVFFEVEVPGGRKVLVKTANEHFVSPSERFFADIEGVLGTGHVRLAGKPTR